VCTYVIPSGQEIITHDHNDTKQADVMTNFTKQNPSLETGSRFAGHEIPRLTVRKQNVHYTVRNNLLLDLSCAN
jgi:hypothetical protein